MTVIDRIFSGETLTKITIETDVSLMTAKTRLISECRIRGILSNARCAKNTARGVRCSNTAILIYNGNPRCLIHLHGELE